MLTWKSHRSPLREHFSFQANMATFPLWTIQNFPRARAAARAATPPRVGSSVKPIVMTCPETQHHDRLCTLHTYQQKAPTSKYHEAPRVNSWMPHTGHIGHGQSPRAGPHRAGGRIGGGVS